MKLWTLIVLVVIVLLLPVYGYVANIVKLCHCDFEPSYKAEAIRTAGIIIPPVGVITGFCSIKDGNDED